MRVFVDTSAFLALMVSNDAAHPRARAIFERLRAADARLTTSSYVLVETYALLGRRLGREAVAQFRAGFAPLLEVLWVGAAEHEAALDLLLSAGRSRLSLVDAVSFVLVDREAFDSAFAFDDDFDRRGIPTLA